MASPEISLKYLQKVSSYSVEFLGASSIVGRNATPYSPFKGKNSFSISVNADICGVVVLSEIAS